MRVALVEDDVDLRENIFLPALREYGYDAVGMGSAGALYRRLLTETFDIVVLDVGLPDESGFDVVKCLRARFHMGIVMLTARGSTPDRVRGLAEGADAYLTKPVDIELLTATLDSLARRMEVNGYSPPAERPWEIHSEGWHLTAPNGRAVDLTQSERCVLGALSRAAGTPVARDLLIAELTDDEYDFDPHRLEMIVYRLRRKVSTETGMALPLRAVRGEGYVLVMGASTPEKKLPSRKAG